MPRSSGKKRGAPYVALQDDLHARVSSRYGLGRGEKGSKKKHQAIYGVKAAEHAEWLAEKEAQRELDEADRAAAQMEADIEAMGSRDGTLSEAGKRGHAVRMRKRSARTLTTPSSSSTRSA